MGCLASFNRLWVICWKAREKKKVIKIKTFNRSVPCINNVQINWNLDNITFLRCINWFSASVCEIRNLMKKQAFSAHSLPYAVVNEDPNSFKKTNLIKQTWISRLNTTLVTKCIVLRCNEFLSSLIKLHLLDLFHIRLILFGASQVLYYTEDLFSVDAQVLHTHMQKKWTYSENYCTWLPPVILIGKYNILLCRCSYNN